MYWAEIQQSLSTGALLMLLCHAGAWSNQLSLSFWYY